MGMYTELNYRVALKPYTPAIVIEVLRTMIGDPGLNGEEGLQGYLPKHPLFTTEGSRWRIVLRGSSAYFPGQSHSSLIYNNCGNYFSLTALSSLKNYGDEIRNLHDWLAPYVEGYKGEVAGYYLYEEDDDPSIIRIGEPI